MSNRDPFADGFERLLATIPATSTLQQWQFAYKEVIYIMGLKILAQFKDDAIGPAPVERMMSAPGPQPGGLPGGGIHPYYPAGQPINPIIHVAAAVLGLDPPPKKPPNG
ncbi:MAG TPA: hypothetical protein VGH12_02860 [Steroidobacteraceae bacterium]|jgi:hypothetical protein